MENNEDSNIKIRKFLKQVGVGSHQIIEAELKKSSECSVCIKVEVNNIELKKFQTIIN